MVLKCEDPQEKKKKTWIWSLLEVLNVWKIGGQGPPTNIQQPENNNLDGKHTV